MKIITKEQISSLSWLRRTHPWIGFKMNGFYSGLVLSSYYVGKNETIWSTYLIERIMFSVGNAVIDFLRSQSVWFSFSKSLW